MEYFSKLTLDRESKQIILNEEAVQSIDADAGDAKIIFIAPLKEEGADEHCLYILNVSDSTIVSEKEEDSYIREIVPVEKLRKVVINEEDNTGTIKIDDDTVKSFNKVFGESIKEFKLAYQESVVGDMKSFKDMYDVKGIFHKITKPTFKKSVIGKSTDVENIEEVINLKKEKE